MKSELGLQYFRRWLGLVLVVTAVLPAVVVLEISAESLAQPWFARMYLVLALLVVAAYIWGVLLPQGKRESEAIEAVERTTVQHGALLAALEELRYFDLVGTAQPMKKLAPDMEHAMEAASRALAGLIQQIQNSSVEVATSAISVQETASNLASGSSQQAAAVVEITATMEELARTAGQIATNAASQAELATRAEEAGNDGAGAVEASVSGVESVRMRMETIAERADSLGRRSREIYRVLELINEIAQETHILSLNAAIEASAAGEHGERFSVVAEEVRRLAERSRESVDSVRSLLEEFTEAIRSVVVATEEGSKEADQVLDLSRSTAGSIEQLSDALSDTSRKSREISLATQEQQTASDQVVLTLKEVSEVIQRMADGLKEFTGASQRLNQLALAIQLLTQSYRIESNHSLKNLVLGWSASLTNYSANLETTEGLLHDLIVEAPFAELIYLVDDQGVMVSFGVNRELVGDKDVATSVGVGQVYSDRPWFQAVKREGRTVLTPLYESLMTGDHCFSIAAAVYDLDGEMTGILGVDINVRNWTKI